ncbi:MbnP family protein [Cytophaga aurantiaca]|uniref:MbnP family protein n=1 Tax=Cytophaga aurantiaca TaxID=29530 RepID=UPI000379971B|nr:MbnP family protein [Cytophaga aurantiaca]
MKHAYILTAVFFSIIFTGCKSNDPAPSNTTVETAPISLHLHTYIGSNEVELYNAVYQTDEGRKMSLSFSQLYISNIKLVKFDGGIYEVGDTILLTNIVDQVYKLGNVPVGNYKSIRFDVGLPANLNAQTPSGTGILNDPDMWFSNTAQANNYIFMNAVGKIDTTAAKDAADADMVPFVYKIGTNSNIVHVSMPNQTVSVQPNTMAYIHMEADYAELFAGLDLKKNDNLSIATKADNTSSLVIDITANMANMFKYEN